MAQQITLTKEFMERAALKILLGTRTAFMDTDVVDDEFGEIGEWHDHEVDALAKALREDLREVFGPEVDVDFVTRPYVFALLSSSIDD